MSTRIIEIDWDYSDQLVQQMLRAINHLGESAGTLSAQRPIKRIDGQGFTAYWAGTILRIDIKESELS